MWESKPLSAAALEDEADYQARLRKVADDLTANEPPARLRSPSPPPAAVTRKQLDDALESLCSMIGKAVRERVIAPLVKRIAELEAREWVGIWEQGKSYAKNSLVSFDGSCWLATRSYPDAKPGSGPNSGWRLIVKRGRDAR